MKGVGNHAQSRVGSNGSASRANNEETKREHLVCPVRCDLDTEVKVQSIRQIL